VLVARAGGTTSFGLGLALLVAKYFCYAEEEQSGDRHGGRLPLVPSERARSASGDGRIRRRAAARPRALHSTARSSLAETHDACSDEGPFEEERSQPS
jgi:hypothetical protein